MARYFKPLRSLIPIHQALVIYNTKHMGAAVDIQQDKNSHFVFSNQGYQIIRSQLSLNNLYYISMAYDPKQIMKLWSSYKQVGKYFINPAHLRKCAQFSTMKNNKSYFDLNQFKNLSFSIDQNGNIQFWQKTDSGMMQLSGPDAIDQFFYKYVKNQIKQQNQVVFDKYYKLVECSKQCQKNDSDLQSFKAILQQMPSFDYNGDDVLFDDDQNNDDDDDDGAGGYVPEDEADKKKFILAQKRKKGKQARRNWDKTYQEYSFQKKAKVVVVDDNVPAQKLKYKMDIVREADIAENIKQNKLDDIFASYEGQIIPYALYLTKKQKKSLKRSLNDIYGQKIGKYAFSDKKIKQLPKKIMKRRKVMPKGAFDKMKKLYRQQQQTLQSVYQINDQQRKILMKSAITLTKLVSTGTIFATSLYYLLQNMPGQIMKNFTNDVQKLTQQLKNATTTNDFKEVLKNNKIQVSQTLNKNLYDVFKGGRGGGDTIKHYHQISFSAALLQLGNKTQTLIDNYADLIGKGSIQINAEQIVLASIEQAINITNSNLASQIISTNGVTPQHLGSVFAEQAIAVIKKVIKQKAEKFGSWIADLATKFKQFTIEKLGQIWGQIGSPSKATVIGMANALGVVTYAMAPQFLRGNIQYGQIQYIM